MLRADHVTLKGEVRRYIQDFDGKKTEGKEHLGDLGADGRLILK
jgi:hypothetical protein